MPLNNALLMPEEYAAAVRGSGVRTPSLAESLRPADPNQDIIDLRERGNPFERGLGQAMRGMKAGVQAYGAQALDALGAHDTARGLWGGAQEDQARAEFVAPDVQRLEQIDSVDKAGQWALGAVGQGAAYLPATIGAGVAGRLGLGRALGPTAGSMVGGAGLMLPAEGGQAALEMRNDPATAGMSDGEKFLRSTGVGTANALLEMVPEAGMINRAVKRAPVTTVGQALKGAAKETIKNAAGEALTEGAQDVTGQLNKLNYDPNANYDVMQTINSAAAGGVGAGPMVGGHAVLAQGLDLAAGTGKLGFDKAGELGKVGAKKISDTALGIPSSGVTEAWHTFRDHPEMAQLMGEQALPAELAKGSDEDILAWASAKDARHREAALSIAQRTLESPASSETAKAEAQALLSNPDDPEAWRPFAAARVLEEKSRRVGANIREAASALGSKAGDLIGQVDLGTPEGREIAANKAGLAVRAAGQTAKAAASGLTKKNLEPTYEDNTYAHIMFPKMEAAFGGKLSDDVQLAAASVLKDFVLGRFGSDEHGNVEVPRGLIAAFGDKTTEVVEAAYDTLRRQGRTKEFNNEAPELLTRVKEAMAAEIPAGKNAAGAVRHNLTPEWNEILQDHDHAALADGIRRYLDTGKKDKATERYLDDLFGANKDVVLEQIGRGMARDELKAKSYEGGASERTNTDVREGDEMGSDVAGKDYDAPLAEREPVHEYHFQNKDGAPFDVENVFHLQQMGRLPNELDASRYNTRHDRETGKDFVHTETVGVVDHARETGDSRALSALSALYKKHEADFEKLGDEGLDRMLNGRYKVVRSQERMDNAADPLEIPERELRWGARSGDKINSRSWRDVTNFKGKDVSGVDHGRVHLKQKDGDMFVTSAQKLIGKMWEAKSERDAFEGKTLEATGTQDMLNMFSAGLASLLASGQFSGMEVKLSDGTWQTVDNIEDFPKDFVLFTKPGGEKITLGGIREAGKGKSPKRVPATENFETSDIPNMTRSELARALNKLADGKLLEEGVQPDYDKFVDESRAYISGLEKRIQTELNEGRDAGALQGSLGKAEKLLEAFEARTDKKAPRASGREQALSTETHIVGRQTNIVDRDEHGNKIGSKDRVPASAGAKLEKVDGNWRAVEDLGFKTEQRPVHSTETEEFAANAKDSERSYEEAFPGVELHPKMTAGEQANRALQLNRKLYAEANAKLKDLQAKRAAQPGKNAVLDNAIREQQKVVDKLLARGMDVSARAGVKRNAEPTSTQHDGAKLVKQAEAGLKFLENPPENYTPQRAVAARDWAVKMLAETKGIEDPDIEDARATLVAVRMKAEELIEGDASLAGFEGGPLSNPRFVAWFGDSKAVNKDGTPRVFYHSTNATFDTFDTSKLGTNTTHASTGLGIFLSPDKSRSEVYGQHTMGLYVRMERPYKMGVEEFSGFRDSAHSKKRQRELREQGYDSVFVPADGTTIVFSEYQLKSATDNNGNYGIADANIKRSGEAPDIFGVKLATPEEMKAAQDHVTKTLGPQMQTEWVKEFPHGGSGEWQQGIIRLATSALNPVSVAYHESMHELFSRIVSAGKDKAAQTLLQAANSPLTIRRLERFFADKKYEAVREQIKTDPEERLAYMFQLWAAGKMKFGPETQTVFQKVAKFLRKITGLLTADQKAEEIFQAFYDGKMAEPSAMAQVLDDIEARGEAIKSIGKKLEKPLRMANELVGTAENNMAGSDNPAVRAIQKLFSNRVGDADAHQGFLQAHIQANNQWLNKMGEALRPVEGVEKADLQEALEGLQKGTLSNDPIISAIQKNVRKVLDDMHDYMVKADVRRFDTEAKEWVPIQKLANYFPRSWDTAKLMSEGDKFIAALLEHHLPALEAIAAKANEERANDQHAGEYTASWEKWNNDDTTPVTAEDVAAAIHQRLLTSDGQAELGEQTSSLGYTPMMKAVNQRTLDWIDMTHFAEYQRKDIIQTLTTYVNQATKRAEYAKTFGGDGKILEQKMTEAWHHEVDRLAKERYGIDNAVATARQNAAGQFALGQEANWQKELAAVLMQSESATKELLDAGLKNLEPARRAIMAMEGTLGHDISPLLRKASAYSIVYQNTRLLAYAMFSNLIDPLGIVLRGGELKDAYAAFKRGMTAVGREWGELTGLREAKASDTDEATRIAEMIGTVDCAGFMSTMGTMYGSQYLPQWARDWNDNFFRWNGMESFNKAMRVQATQAAIGFIKRHAEGAGEHSTRYLAELGLTAADVKLDDEGRLNVEDAKIQKAVMRWVDGAILRPNAAMRPAWMSDPHFAVFGHLKQFMYAAHQVLLKRVVHEVRNGNTNPVYLMLAGYVPVMLAADAAKGILQEITGGGAPAWQHDGAAGIFAHGAQRAGLLGQAQMAVDGVKYGPVSLLGPQAEQITSAFGQPVSESLKEAVAVGPLNILTKGAAMTNAVD